MPGRRAPRSDTWSQRDPVTLCGAAVAVRHGWRDVSSVFGWLAGRFSDLRNYEFALIAAGASADLAYTTGGRRPTRCGSPTSTDASPASGRSSTDTAIDHLLSIRACRNSRARLGTLWPPGRWWRRHDPAGRCGPHRRGYRPRRYRLRASPRGGAHGQEGRVDEPANGLECLQRPVPRATAGTR